MAGGGGRQGPGEGMLPALHSFLGKVVPKVKCDLRKHNPKDADFEEWKVRCIFVVVFVE